MFEILNYRPINKNALMGTFDVKVPKWGNFLIKRMSYFKKDNNRWINFPQESYEKDGKKKYFSLNGFEDTDVQAKFLDELKKSLENHLLTLEEAPVQVSRQNAAPVPVQNDFPF